MKGLIIAIADWAKAVFRAWDRFWFTPAQPHALAPRRRRIAHRRNA